LMRKIKRLERKKNGIVTSEMDEEEEEQQI
jgi:hypothetical protein